MGIFSYSGKGYSDLKLRIKRKLKYDLTLIKCLESRGGMPLISKILMTVTILYLLSPIDIIPDFIPVLGILDDVIIAIPLLLLARLFIANDDIIKCKKKLTEGER